MPPAWSAGLARNVIVLGAVSFLNDAASEMIYPLLPVFLATVLGVGPAVLGTIEGVAESTAAFLKLASGYLSDRIHRRKPWVVGGYLVSNLARPLIGLAAGWPMVLALRFIDRVGKGVRSSPRDALIADSTDPAARGRAFGFHRAADHAGAVVGPLLAFALLAWFAADLRTLFWLSILPGAAAVLVLALAAAEPPAAARAEPEPLPLGAAWRQMPAPLRRFGLILLVFTLGNSTDAFLLLKAQQLGVAVALLPILWVVLHVVKTVSSMPAGIASDRVGRKRLILAGWGVYVVTYGGFMLADAAWQAWALFALYGLFFGLTEGVEKALIADLAPPRLRGSAFGLYHLTVGLGALPASVLFGAAWELYGSAAAFGLGAALALVAALLLAGLRLEAREAPTA